jgi:hypothetical protein
LISLKSVYANSELLITDSLVKDLDCSTLSADSIYASIKVENFSYEKHIPIRNWSFNNGPYSLGVCWSLSHTQRLFFYLSQWNNPFLITDDQTTNEGLNILNLIRGSKPLKGKFTEIREIALKHFYNFKIHSFSLETGIFADLVNGIWDPLISLSLKNKELYPEKIENGKLLRKFTTEVEKYQQWRFYQFENSKLATEKIPRSKKINSQLSQQLISNLNKKKLPLVDIKPNMTAQHIVLIKFYEKTDTFIKYYIYDSNFPKYDNYFIYDIESQEFKAPEIIKHFPGVNNPNQDISVYLVDDEDHNKIGDTLLNYYKHQCK